MNCIDKFLKKLNASRNTFATYILTLLTVYFAVDRIVELLFMIFTGVSVSYWGPIMYTFALACPVFALMLSFQSEFAPSQKSKVTLFYAYSIALYIIALSMFNQWLNMGAWLLFISVPNYVGIITEFSDLVKPAFSALSIYLPLITIFPLIKKLFLGVNDSNDMIKSIYDSKGLSLSKNTEGTGPYSCELYLFVDDETGKKVKIRETKRFQPMLICGASGSGKTTLVLEPFMARDIERKYFFREVSKEMGYTALKTGIATLKCPYGNNYINENFTLNMLAPIQGKETLYKAYLKKLIMCDETGELIYKNVGLTCIAPDIEIITHMAEVCDNFKIKYNIIDPSSVSTIGLNPFIYEDPSKIATTISSVLRGMYRSVKEEKEDVYDEDVTLRAIENIAILLKEMYPRMNDGLLPNLEDMLKLLTKFELVEKMCKIMETDEKLAEKYSVQLAYFKRHFYKGGEGVQDTLRAVHASIAQLDNLLRAPGVKQVLCNRRRNINFDEMLANGEVTFLCTRRGDLGASGSKALGLFFLLALQNAVLSRPGIEKSRVPNFLYIDEFPDYICKDTEPMFTMYRKYRVGVVISSQSLAQLSGPQDNQTYKETILANCVHKIHTGGTTPDEALWWEKEMNRRRKWKYQASMDTSTLTYDSKWSNVNYDWEDNFKQGKVLALSFKKCAYRIQTESSPQYGRADLNFLEAKYKEPKPVKEYDFSVYNKGKRSEEGSAVKATFKRNKFNLKDITFQDRDSNDGFDPVQTDPTDSSYFFDNDDAVSVNLKRRKKS